LAIDFLSIEVLKPRDAERFVMVIFPGVTACGLTPGYFKSRRCRFHTPTHPPAKDAVRSFYALNMVVVFNRL